MSYASLILSPPSSSQIVVTLEELFYHKDIKFLLIIWFFSKYYRENFLKFWEQMQSWTHSGMGWSCLTIFYVKKYLSILFIRNCFLLELEWSNRISITPFATYRKFRCQNFGCHVMFNNLRTVVVSTEPEKTKR